MGGERGLDGGRPRRGLGEVDVLEHGVQALACHRSAGETQDVVVGSDGAVVSRHEFDRAIVGDRLAGLLVTPNGVLYMTTDSDTLGRQVVAVELGIGATPTWFGNGTTWANDNATWHQPPFVAP